MSSNEPAVLIKRGRLGSGEPEELTGSRKAPAAGSQLFPGRSGPSLWGPRLARTPPPLLQHQGKKVSIEFVHLKQAQVKSTRQDGGLVLHYSVLIIITSNGN